ncbi:MAG: hypothetical protein P8Y51_10135 [Campylobacterales bacterium]
MEIEAMFDVVMDAIVTVRRAKTLIDMGNQRIDEAYVKTDAATSEAMEAYICRLGKVENVGFVAEKMENAVSDIGEQVEVFIPTGSIDLAPIIDRLNKQNAKLEKEIAKLAGMLNNERFVANAPEEVVATNREALVDAQNKQRKILDQLESLQGA